MSRWGVTWGGAEGVKTLRDEERRDEKTGACLGLRVLEQELLEVSAVPVPANRSALRRRAQLDQSGLAAIWPVLASQVDELAKLAEEIADTVTELETAAKGEEPGEIRADPMAEIISVLHAGRD